MSNSHRNLNSLTVGDDVLLDAEEEVKEEVAYGRLFCGEHPGHENVLLLWDIEPWCPEANGLVEEVISDIPVRTVVMRGVRLKQRHTR